MQKKSVTLITSLFSVFAGLCLAVLGLFFLDSRYYYITAILIVVFAMLPFFVGFEKRKLSVPEIVIIALMTALCVAGRSAFIFLPQVKPLCAVVVTTAVAFGAQTGFIVGALSMFLSGFVFGQGAFTPFQMMGMGLVGFVCGLLFCGRKGERNRVAVSVAGGVLCFALYGIVVDTCSVLMMTTDYTFKSVTAIYLSGIPFNIIHGVTTGVLLFFIHIPMNNKFSRLRIKYGIFDRSIIE